MLGSGRGRSDGAGGKAQALLPKGGEEEAECQPSAAAASSFQRWWQSAHLIVYAATLLLVSIGNQIYFKRMTSAMPNYGWYLTQLSTVVYVPVFLAMAGTCSVDKDLLTKFVMMGVFDGITGILTVLGGVHTSGTMQVLLSQVIIPMTLIFSVMFAKKRYHIYQYLGSAVIVIGVVLATMCKGDGNTYSSDLPVFNGIFIIATMPGALSTVFKEVAFTGYDGDLDVNVLQFWVALFQTVTNFVCMPVYTLDLLGPQQMLFSEMIGSIWGGSRCLFLQENQVILNCGFDGEKPCDHCPDAWKNVIGYLLFNFTYNVVTMLVIKHGGATVCFLIATLRMPMSSLAFSSSYVMGADAVPASASDFYILAVILLGLCMYRHGGQLTHKQLQPEPSPPSRSGEVKAVSWRSPRSTMPNRKYMPLFTTGMPVLQPDFVMVKSAPIRPRSPERLRSDLYRRLGAASPLNSPQNRHRSPRQGPSPPPRGPASVAVPTAAAPLQVAPQAVEKQGEERWALKGLPPDLQD
eukprot:TRINITY_DN19563_c0_g1_i2.p1 TRINITY_DN19563_c0_g1~~TRINITY_DN19563_c0_g1_i2.p1  ORF type:complete len:520 (-),score=89.07 TRINITY_DN19563_c0_g1_i2:506-2065(-)